MGVSVRGTVGLLSGHTPHGPRSCVSERARSAHQCDRFGQSRPVAAPRCRTRWALGPAWPPLRRAARSARAVGRFDHGRDGQSVSAPLAQPSSANPPRPRRASPPGLRRRTRACTPRGQAGVAPPGFCDSLQSRTNVQHPPAGEWSFARSPWPVTRRYPSQPPWDKQPGPSPRSRQPHTREQPAPPPSLACCSAELRPLAHLLGTPATRSRRAPASDLTHDALASRTRRSARPRRTRSDVPEHHRLGQLAGAAVIGVVADHPACLVRDHDSEQRRDQRQHDEAAHREREGKGGL